MKLAWVLVVLGTASATAHAQSINVSFGHTSGAPSSSYAAAGAAGVWNAVTGISGPTFTLVDTDGAPTSVTLTQSPTTTVLANPDPSVSGDDAALLDNGLVTNGAETCLAFSGFQPGTYEVLVYAWLPNQPTMLSRTRQDEAPSTIDVGGAWTGAHAAGITYARYVVTVDASGSLPAHSGLAPNTALAALNGVQIRPLPATGSPDAGVVTPPDAAVTQDPDAGASAANDNGGGCSTGGGGASWLAIAMIAGLAIRTSRRRRAR
jgi:hypothetical protein